jgi:hypothetical protein
MNLEHQTNPAIKPGSSWVEIDHASDAVDYDPQIAADVYEYFDVIVDPTDAWNKWAVPIPGVVMLGKDVEYDEDGATIFRYRSRFGVPYTDGPYLAEAYLVYEDAGWQDAHSAGKYRVVRVEFSGNLLLDTSTI